MSRKELKTILVTVRFIVGRKAMTDLGTIMEYISMTVKIRVIKLE